MWYCSCFFICIAKNINSTDFLSIIINVQTRTSNPNHTSFTGSVKRPSIRFILSPVGITGSALVKVWDHTEELDIQLFLITYKVRRLFIRTELFFRTIFFCWSSKRKFGSEKNFVTVLYAHQLFHAPSFLQEVLWWKFETIQKKYIFSSFLFYINYAHRLFHVPNRTVFLANRIFFAETNFFRRTVIAWFGTVR